MSVPLQKHYEQCLNAHLVQRGGYGIACPRPTPEEIDAFLDGRYRRMPQWDPDAFSREVEGRALQYVV